MKPALQTLLAATLFVILMTAGQLVILHVIGEIGFDGAALVAAESAPEVVAAAVEPSRGSPVEVAVMPAAVPVPFVNVVAPRKVASGSRAALITAPIPYKPAIVGARHRPDRRCRCRWCAWILRRVSG